MPTFDIACSFEKKGEYVILGKPETNKYQEIADLSFSGKELPHSPSTILLLNPGTTMHFRWQGKAISESISPLSSLSSYTKKEEIYLIPNAYINGEDTTIRKIAREVIEDKTSLKDIVAALYFHTLSVLTYDNPIDGLYTYKEAFTQKHTDCGGFSTYLASLIQSQGIPVRLVSGFFINPSTLQKIMSTITTPTISYAWTGMHAWIEMQLPDMSWIPLDPATEWRQVHGLSERKGGLGTVEADRLVVSLGCDHMIDLDGKQRTFPLLQHPIYV